MFGKDQVSPISSRDSNHQALLIAGPFFKVFFN